MPSSANQIQFWLKYNNGAEQIRLPVNPKSIKVDNGHTYNDVSVNGLGEYTLIGDPQLREYSFESFLPRDYNPSYCEYENFPTPSEIVRTIERWVRSRRPIRLVVTRTPINIVVTIRKFDYEHVGVGEISYSLTLKEYVFLDFKRIKNTTKAGKTTATAQTGKATARPNEKGTPSEYVVKSGDSLWKIAQRYLGSGSKWRTIYEKNKAAIGKNPSQLKVGMRLKL